VNYYYAVDGQQNGPVTEEQLDQLVTSGSLSPETLVWKEGMANWEAYSTLKPGVAPAVATATAAALSVANPPVANGVVCGVCHGIFPPDQVIRYGSNYVCGGCKPRFVQSLREGVNVGGGLQLAGIGKRFGAKFIDNLLVALISGAIQAGVVAAYPQNSVMLIVAVVIRLALTFGYPIFFYGKWGQTLGKMAMKIKVVTPEGGPITYGKAAVRVLSEMLSGCILGIGYLMALWDDEKRALHDRLAGTRVVDAPK
jgi:uncharacterized RDD family membrane protein YckC